MLQISDIGAMQAIVDRSTFNRFLGLRVTALDAEKLVLHMPWQAGLVSSPELQSTHGGVLATLVDVACDYAVAALVGHAVPTVDLRIDYHRIAKPGDLTVEARVLHLGRTLACAEAVVLDAAGARVASGRGQYLSSVGTAKK
ncbi:MAG: PaaI family thioesterase [Pseudomonadota bacterium]